MLGDAARFPSRLRKLCRLVRWSRTGQDVPAGPAPAIRGSRSAHRKAHSFRLCTHSTVPYRKHFDWDRSHDPAWDMGTRGQAPPSSMSGRTSTSRLTRSRKHHSRGPPRRHGECHHPSSYVRTVPYCGMMQEARDHTIRSAERRATRAKMTAWWLCLVPYRTAPCVMYDSPLDRTRGHTVSCEPATPTGR